MKSKAESKKRGSRNLSNDEKLSHNNKTSKELRVTDKRNASTALMNGNLPKVKNIDCDNQQPSLQIPPDFASYFVSSDFQKMNPDFIGDIAYLFVSDKILMSRVLIGAAELNSENFQKNMHPKDALEGLALKQAQLAHARVALLTILLTNQHGLKSFSTVSEACERATGSFIRLYRTIAECRRPSSSGTSVSIARAILANQQVVQNSPQGEAKGKNGVRTRIGDKGKTIAKALPPHKERPKVIAANDPEK